MALSNMSLRTCSNVRRICMVSPVTSRPEVQGIQRERVRIRSRNLLSPLARYWGLARCGHHPFCDGRSARHRGNSIRPCRFCASHADTLAHALLHCTAHRAVRERWRSRARPGQLLNLSRYSAPPQSPTVPATLRTMYALLPVYALPLRHVKCDATNALRRTVVSRLMV